MERTRVERLCDYLWNSQRQTFEYGVHDCSTFVARWVDLELGTNYADRVEGLVRQRTMLKLRRSLKDVGAYCRLVVEIVGKEPCEDYEWKPGDICVFTQEGHLETLGILSSRLVYAPGPVGLVGFDASRKIYHWSLECLLP